MSVNFSYWFGIIGFRLVPGSMVAVVIFAPMVLFRKNRFNLIRPKVG